MRHHLARLERYRAAEKTPLAFLGIFDNCVGQNKSNVTMQLMCLLSVIAYMEVAALFFIPGHSHMLNDRVWGWCKRTLNRKNVYDAESMVALFNTVEAVNAKVLTREDADRPFRYGWTALFNKHFRKMPAQFTFNYFFSFKNGVCTYRHLADTSDSMASTFTMFENSDTNRNSLLQDMWGSNQVS